MERTTRKQVEGTFARFAEASGLPDLQLEHHPSGYIIYQGMESGGVREPFGSRLRPAGEMWATLHFALNLLGELRNLTVEQRREAFNR